MTTATDQLDAICRRQTARFISHLKDTGQHSERLASDFKRMMRFTFNDIKQVLPENYTEQSHVQVHR